MRQKQPEVLGKLGTETITSTNYADIAEARIKGLRTVGRDGKPDFGGLTTTKLRSIYALIMNIYTKINEPADFQDHLGDLQYLKVKMAYEAGREDKRQRPVSNFLAQTGLRDLVSNVKNYDQFVLYCRYAESLVAYFKFYGGKDKD